MKHTRRVKNQQRRVIEQKEYFHGYKAPVSLNSESELITSMVYTPGNAYDGHQLPKLLEKDLARRAASSVPPGRASCCCNGRCLELAGKRRGVAPEDSLFLLSNSPERTQLTKSSGYAII